MKEIPILFDKKESCCGCYACYSICPKSAILMVEDENGFVYPKIDSERCIRCHQCVNICPIKKQIEVKEKCEKEPKDV